MKGEETAPFQGGSRGDPHWMMFEGKRESGDWEAMESRVGCLSFHFSKAAKLCVLWFYIHKTELTRYDLDLNNLLGHQAGGWHSQGEPSMKSRLPLAVQPGHVSLAEVKQTAIMPFFPGGTDSQPLGQRGQMEGGRPWKYQGKEIAQ